MGWNELSDPDMRTENFEFSCDVYREGVYIDNFAFHDNCDGGEFCITHPFKLY